MLKMPVDVYVAFAPPTKIPRSAVVVDALTVFFGCTTSRTGLPSMSLPEYLIESVYEPAAVIVNVKPDCPPLLPLDLNVFVVAEFATERVKMPFPCTVCKLLPYLSLLVT